MSETGKISPKESAKGENALYVFNRLTRMATENELSTWKQNQVRNFLRHEQVDEILELSDDFGRTVLDNACIAGNMRLVQLLLPKNARMKKSQVTMIHTCSHIAVLDFLLSERPELAKEHVSVGSVNDGIEKMPLLNYCAKTGNERAVNILLKHNFKSPESIALSLDEHGNTPLHVARNEDVAAQLLKRAGDISVLRVTNKKGQDPSHAATERYNAIQQNIGFGNNQEILLIERSLVEKTLSFYKKLMTQDPGSGYLSGNPDTRQMAAETMQSILQRRMNAFPHRSNIPKPYTDHQLISAVARKRAIQQQHHQQQQQQHQHQHQHQQPRFPLRNNHQLHMMGGTASIHQHQQEQNPFNRRHLLGEGASIETIQNQMAMNRQESIKQTAIALSEIGRNGREWDSRLEHYHQQQQQQQQQNEQKYLSGMTINNPLFKEAAAMAAMGAPVGGHMIPSQLSSRVPSIPLDSLRLGLAGMRPASPLPDTSLLQRLSPGGRGTPTLPAQQSRKPKPKQGKGTEKYHGQPYPR